MTPTTKMSLYLCVFKGDEELEGVEVGSYEDWKAFVHTVCESLEGRGIVRNARLYRFSRRQRALGKHRLLRLHPVIVRRNCSRRLGDCFQVVTGGRREDVRRIPSREGCDFLHLLLGNPFLARLDISEQESRALIVGGIQP